MVTLAYGACDNPMGNTEPSAQLRDPLAEVTRRERRMLLAVSVLAIFIAHSGIVPSEIAALGIKLAPSNQRAFLITMTMVVGYFFVAFVIYGSTDYLAWRIAYEDELQAINKEVLRKLERQEKPDNSISTIVSHDWRAKWPDRLAHPASIARAVFEFALPLLVGVYAIYALYVSTAERVA